MRSFLLVALLVVTFSVGSASAWFGRKPEDSVTTFKKDASKALESAKVVGKEKTASAKAKAKELEEKTKKSAKAKAKQLEEKAKKSAKQVKKDSEMVAEEGKGLLEDVKKRFSRMFEKGE